MTIEELVEKLATFPWDMKVHVFTTGEDYGTPQVSLVVKKGKPSCVTITAAEDE